MPLIAKECAFMIRMRHAEGQRGFAIGGWPAGRAFWKQTRQPSGELIVTLIGDQTMRRIERRQRQCTVTGGSSGAQRTAVEHRFGAFFRPFVQRAHDQIHVDITDHEQRGG